MSEVKTPEKGNQFRLAEWFPDLTEAQLSKLKIYHDDLLLINKSASLLPHKSLGSVDSVYFADCIHGSRLIRKDNSQMKKILDLGSGVGLPSLIFAILYPDVQVVCLDPDFRKCAFVREMIAKLDLKNVEVFQNALEQYNESDLEAAMTRDFNTLSRTLLGAKKLIRSGGAFYHFKGEEWAMEVSDMPSQLCSLWQPSLVGEYKIPGGGVKKEYIIKTIRI